MPQVKYLRRIPQTKGLTGRKYRTPITEKHAERFTGLVPIRNRLERPILAHDLDEPGIRRERLETGAEGVGSESSGFGYGSDFGETVGERAALAAMPVSDMFGIPAVKGAKTAAQLIGMNAPADITTMASLLSMAPLLGINAIKKGIPRGLQAKGVAAQIDSMLEGFDPTTADIIGQAAEETLNEEHNPNYIAQTFVTPEQYAIQSLLAQQNKNPQPFMGMFAGIGNQGGGGFPGGGMGPAGTPGAAGMDAGPGASSSGGNVGPGVGPGGPPGGEGPGAEAGEAGGEGLSVLCTSLYKQGLMPQSIYLGDVAYAANLDSDILNGYRSWAKHVARLMDRSKFVTNILKWPVLKWAKHMAFYGSGAKVGKPSWFGRFAEYVGCPVCKLIGKFMRA